MLCNLKTTNRPDKILQSKLVALMYFLSMLFVSILSLVILPQYFLYIFTIIFFCVVILFVLGLKIVKASQEAISFGGFAANIIKNDSFSKRIEAMDGKIVLENSSSKQIFANTNILKFIKKHNNDCQAEYNKLKKAFDNLSFEETELCLEINGLLQYFNVLISPIYLKKEDVFNSPFSIKKIYKQSYVLWSFENITNKKSLEKVFISEQKYLLDFLDYLPVGVYTIDSDYNIEYANYALAKILQTNKDSLIGKNLKDFITQSSSIPKSLNLWSGRIMLNIANAGLIEASVFQSGFKQDDKIKSHGVLLTGLLSEAELLEELNDCKNLEDLLFEKSPIGVIFSSKSGDVLKVNKSALDFISPNTKNLIKDLNIDLSQPITNININNKDLSFYIKKSNSKGEYILFVIDISKQKSLELQFYQAQKMQALGQMATGISHDFNNLLTAMIGFCDLLLARHGLGDPSFEDLVQIKINANRAAGLVQYLLAFSKKQTLKNQVIDVVDGISEITHTLLKRILGDNIKLDVFHSTTQSYINIDPTQLSQVVTNLAINAKDAMDGKGTLSIKTSNYTLETPYQFAQDLIQPNDFVCLEFSDTGCGISPENLSKIFDPFFSTKQNVVGSGTGLGLAMVYGVIRQAEGFIKVKSQQGEGTTFYIYLPSYDKPQDDQIQNKTILNGKPVMEVKQELEVPINVSQKIVYGLNVSTIDRQIQESSVNINNARVLFVEDDHSVRTFGVRALSKKGFDVTQASTAEEALDILKEDKNFDILFSDVYMPGISGVELAKLIKDDIKDIKIVLTSGYTKELLLEEQSCGFDFEFLAKPYSLGDLTKMIVSVL